jgi:cytochrome P450
MANRKIQYHFPHGYTLSQSIFKSFRFLTNPLRFISASMDKFSGTYSAKLPNRRTLILTQDSEFINYVLKDNHSNYQKSEISSTRAAVFFGKGLLFSNGEKWLRQRRLIQPGFHQKKIQELNEIVINTINAFLAEFPTGSRVDVYPLMNQLAFNIVINSLFNVDISKHDIQEIGKAFTDLQDFLFKDINSPIQKYLYAITGKERNALNNSKRIRNIIQGIIDKRVSENKACNDLLDMLLNARYEDTGEPMSGEQIIDEVLVLIFAGHETTANTLAWVLYLLSKDPWVMGKLQDTIRLKNIQESVKDDYVIAVINETMRLYPAAWMTERVAIKDDIFGGFSYPEGTIIIPFFYGLHRNKDYWNDELKFSPERFLSHDHKIIKAKNYFPFGTGPRMCIGNSFAMAEMSFFLHAFFNQYTIAPTEYTPKLKPLITLRPSHVYLDIQKR